MLKATDNNRRQGLGAKRLPNNHQSQMGCLAELQQEETSPPLQSTGLSALLGIFSFHPPATFSCGRRRGKHHFLIPRELRSCEKRLDGELMLSGRNHLFCLAWFLLRTSPKMLCQISFSVCRICLSSHSKNTTALLKMHPIK